MVYPAAGRSLKQNSGPHSKTRIHYGRLISMSSMVRAGRQIPVTIYLTVLLSVLNQIGLKGSKMLVALYAIELGANPFAIGLLISIYAFFPLLLAVYAGRVSDRIGVRWPMVLGSLGMALGLSFPVIMPSMTALYLSAAMIGISNIFFHVSTHNLVGSLGDSHDRTSNFGTFSLGAATAGFLGPMLTGISIDHFGHVPTYACLAIVAGIPGVILLGYARFIPPRVTIKHEEQTRGMRELLRAPALRRTLITSGLILTGIDLFNFYMPIYGRSVGLSASVIGAILGAYAAAAFVVRLMMTKLSMRFGEERILAASLVTAGVTYFLFPMFQHPVVLGAIAFFLGLGLGCGQPLSIILTYNHAPAGRAGEALGMRLTVNKFTQILVPVVFGSLGTLGVYPVFWANAVLLSMSGYLNAKREG